MCRFTLALKIDTIGRVFRNLYDGMSPSAKLCRFSWIGTKKSEADLAAETFFIKQKINIYVSKTKTSSEFCLGLFCVRVCPRKCRCYPSTTIYSLAVHEVPQMFYLSRFSIVHNRQKYYAKPNFRFNDRKLAIIWASYHPRRASEYQPISCAGCLFWSSFDNLRPDCNTAALRNIQ